MRTKRVGGGKNKPSAALIALTEHLADGEWHESYRALAAMKRVIPPGEASRAAMKVLTRPDLLDMEELVESGRRSIARLVLTGALERGRIEIDVERLTRRHWSGEEAWKVRDPMPGARSVVEVATELDITGPTLRHWIANGYVPSSKAASGVLRLTPVEVEAARRVREIWPGPSTKTWPVDPRSVWAGDLLGESSTTVRCPHCKGEIFLTMAKPPPS